MEVKDTLIIASEFDNSPGARSDKDGEDSGKKFLDEFLEKRFLLAVEGDYKLLIDLDGVYGYPSSFVSGSFGALSVAHTKELVLKHLDFKSERRPIRIPKILEIIENPYGQQ